MCSTLEHLQHPGTVKCRLIYWLHCHSSRLTFSTLVHCIVLTLFYFYPTGCCPHHCCWVLTPLLICDSFVTADSALFQQPVATLCLLCSWSVGWRWPCIRLSCIECMFLLGAPWSSLRWQSLGAWASCHVICGASRLLLPQC